MARRKWLFTRDRNNVPYSRYPLPVKRAPSSEPVIRVHDKVSYQRRDRTGAPLGKPVIGFVDRTSATAVYIHDNSTGDIVAASRNRVEKVA